MQNCYIACSWSDKMAEKKRKNVHSIYLISSAHISPPGRSIFCPTSSGLKRWDSALSPLSSLGNEWEMLCEKGVMWECICCDISAPEPRCPSLSLCLSLPWSCHPCRLAPHKKASDYCEHETVFFSSGMKEGSLWPRPLIHLMLVRLSLIINSKAYSNQINSYRCLKGHRL